LLQISHTIAHSPFSSNIVLQFHPHEIATTRRPQAGKVAESSPDLANADRLACKRVQTISDIAICADLQACFAARFERTGHHVHVGIARELA
jgi:hypothetical protein